MKGTFSKKAMRTMRELTRKLGDEGEEIGDALIVTHSLVNYYRREQRKLLNEILELKRRLKIAEDAFKNISKTSGNTYQGRQADYALFKIAIDDEE